MRNHERLHRRQGRSAFPDPKAIADALADAFPNPFADPAPQRTVVSVIYITASPTFDGPVGGYKTLAPGEDPNGDSSKASSTKQGTTTKKDANILVDTSSFKSKSQTSLQTTTGLPSEITAPTGGLTSSAALLAATGSFTRSTTSKKSTATQEASTNGDTPVATGGMSTGGKAGLAIGILLLVGAVLAIALFVFKKRKDKVKKQQAETEKAAMFSASNGRAASVRTNATAPRLSLRPVTQFLPNLGEKRSSRGNVLSTMAAGASARQHASSEQNRNNPFGNNAEVIDSTNANGPTPIIQVNGSPNGIGGVAAAPQAAGLARGASKRVNGANPMDFTTKNSTFMGPPSPSGTEFSQSSDSASTPTPSGTGAAIAAAGGPANTAVHRVQLDFKPSMEDELELRAGQLVRLLHEYDDGWALCIRLDRSQQGVAPRTCLSTRPVKPRPQQGQRGSPPGQRGPQGQMRSGSPPTNGGYPANGAPRGFAPMGQGNRPESPSGRNSPGPQYNAQRPHTPQGQGRPMTPQGQDRRNSPPGSSSMNHGPIESQPMSSSPPSNFGSPVGRKPVPGQAL